MSWNKSTKETAKRNERRKTGWKRNVKSVSQMTGRNKQAGCKGKEKITENTALIAKERALNCKEETTQGKETEKSLKNTVKIESTNNEDCKIKEEKRRCSMVVELISVGTEILLGNIVNTNAAFLSEKCAALGLATRERYTGMCQRAGIPCVFIEDLGRAIGKDNRMIAAVTEAGFARMIKEAMEA